MNPPASITINGQTLPCDSPTALPALLASLGLEQRPVVIELNGRAIPRSEHPSLTIRPGDSLEIVTLAAGG